MRVDEFIEKHSDEEIAKLARIKAAGGVNPHENRSRGSIK